MGIKGQWDLINQLVTLQPTTLAEESKKHFDRTGKPLRVAVDASILIWKLITGANAMAIENGMNHASKAFMYHACNYMKDGVQAIYVFDGPGRPQAKRGKTRPNPKPRPDPKTTPQRVLEDNLHHVTALVKEVLCYLRLPYHEAPGEAEAECVEMEKAEIVDAIITTDGDALAFGGQLILRYSKKMSDGMQMISAEELRKSLGKDKGSWILLALLSGADYSDGVKGCGDAFAKGTLALAVTPGSATNKLCSILRSNSTKTQHQAMLKGWREKILNTFREDVRTISAFMAGNIPADFPDDRIVNLYLHPVVSSAEAILQLKARQRWSETASIHEFRAFTARTFEWEGRTRAKQFLYTLTPGLLAQQMLVAGNQSSDCTRLLNPAKPPKRFNGEASKEVPMIKVWYKALSVAPIDYESEQEMPPTFRTWKPGEGDKHEPRKAYETKLPEFLLRFGAPSCSIDGESPRMKRKASVSGQECGKPAKKNVSAKKNLPVKASVRAGPHATAGRKVTQSSNFVDTGGFENAKLSRGTTATLACQSQGPTSEKAQKSSQMSSKPGMDQSAAASSRNDSLIPLEGVLQRSAPLGTISPNAAAGISSLETIDLTEDD